MQSEVKNGLQSVCTKPDINISWELAMTKGSVFPGSLVSRQKNFKPAKFHMISDINVELLLWLRLVFR